MKNYRLQAATFSFLLVLALGRTAYADGDDEKKAPQIKGTITMDKDTRRADLVKFAKTPFKTAMGIALKKAPGRLIFGELEVITGFLVYSFETVGKDGVITEVEVDPGTGKVLSVVREEGDEAVDGD